METLRPSRRWPRCWRQVRAGQALAPWRTSGRRDPVVGPQPRVSSSERGSMLRRSLESRDAQTRQLQDAVTKVEKHFKRAVPDICCLCAENRPTARQSGPPGERNQRVCLYRDPALKAGPEKLCGRVCQTSGLSTSRG